MNREEVEAKPAEKWLSSLNAVCNRLTTQYLTLLKSAAGMSTVAKRNATPDAISLTEGHRGGGVMLDPNEPPPALAADSALISLQTKLAAQNIAVASSNLLDLIRTLRLSALLMEEQVIDEEEEIECEICMEETQAVARESAILEGELFNLWRDELMAECHPSSDT